MYALCSKYILTTFWYQIIAAIYFASDLRTDLLFGIPHGGMTVSKIEVIFLKIILSISYHIWQSMIFDF